MRIIGSKIKGEVVSRRGKGPLRAGALRTLFSKIIGEDFLGGIRSMPNGAAVAFRYYVGWAAFRAGIEIGQTGTASEATVAAVRKHMQNFVPAEGRDDYEIGYSVMVRTPTGRVLIPSGDGQALPFVTRDKAHAVRVREKLHEGGISSRIVQVQFCPPIVDDRGMQAGDPRMVSHTGPAGGTNSNPAPHA